MEDPWGLMVCVRGIWGTFGILVAVLCGKNGQHHVCYCDVGLACWFVVCVYWSGFVNSDIQTSK